MKFSLFTQISVTTALLLMTSTALAAVKDASPHRKVDGKGIGNCVFSTSELSKGQDSSYSLSNSFTAPQSVHARCYFPDTLDAYAKVGKVFNSMRDESQYWTSLMIKGQGGLVVIDRGLYDLNPTWDQQRFDIDGTAENADFGLDESDAKRYGALVKSSDTSEYSLNLPNYVKAMAAAAGKYPYTASFCMDVYTDIADTVQTETKYDDFGKKWVTKDVPQVKSYIISRGCFDYTINSASDVSWNPSQNTEATETTPEKNPIDQAKDLLDGIGF